MLARGGIASVEAANLQQAMRLLSTSINVVYLKLILPDGSGVELLRHVRREQLDMRVIIVSGADEPNLFSQVLPLRPDAIFGRPLDAIDFFDWLNTRRVDANHPACSAVYLGTGIRRR
jgi:DNA-binding NarL/FixJ family response regulator